MLFYVTFLANPKKVLLGFRYGGRKNGPFTARIPFFRPIMYSMTRIRSQKGTFYRWYSGEDLLATAGV